jgi:hypothetical protein
MVYAWTAVSVVGPGRKPSQSGADPLVAAGPWPAFRGFIESPGNAGFSSPFGGPQSHGERMASRDGSLRPIGNRPTAAPIGQSGGLPTRRRPPPGCQPALHGGKPRTELARVRTSEGWPGGQPRTRGSAPLWLGFLTAPLQSLPRLRSEEWIVRQNRRGARRKEGIVIHPASDSTSMSHTHSTRAPRAPFDPFPCGCILDQAALSKDTRRPW